MRNHLLVLAVLVGGCGSATPAQECQKLATEICHRAFRCDPNAATDTGFPTESACATAQAGELDCMNAMAVCTYDTGALDKCLSDLDAQSCTVMSLPASCDLSQICPGQLVCSGESSSSNSGVCSLTFDQCSDGHSYGASCNGAMCTCQIDGVGGKMFTAAIDICANNNDTGKQAIKTNCGYTFQ